METVHQKKVESPKFSDAEIVERVLHGEKQLFEILLRRYNQLLFRVVRSYIKSEDDTRDIMQEAYVKAFTKLTQFKSESSFSTWLIRIGINEALQELRRTKRIRTKYGVPQNLDTLIQMTDPNSMNPEKRAITTETRTLIEEAVDRLPKKYRVIFVMRQVEGLPTAEIADCLDLSESNVKVRLHRAKKMLKEELFNITHDASIFEFGNEKCDRMVEKVMERILNR